MDSVSSEEAARLFREQQESRPESSIRQKRPPKFKNQIPNLTLKPGNEAVIDIEVESLSWTKYVFV